MNKVLLRFYILAIDDFVELELDNRISFKDNFNLLKNIYEIKYQYIVDLASNIALKDDVPLKNYNFPYLTRLLIL